MLGPRCFELCVRFCHVFTGHDTRSSPIFLPPCDRANDQEGFFARRDSLRQRRIRRLVREILFAGKEAQERPPLLRDVVSNCSLQHGITSLKRVEDGTLRHRAFNFQRHLVADVRQVSHMEWKCDTDHSLLMLMQATPRFEDFSGLPGPGFEGSEPIQCLPAPFAIPSDKIDQHRPLKQLQQSFYRDGVG